MILPATILTAGMLNLAAADSTAMARVLNNEWCPEDAVVTSVIPNPHHPGAGVTVVDYLHPLGEARIYMTDSMAVAVGCTVEDAETDIYIVDRASETVPYILRLAASEPDVSVGPEALIEISYTESAVLTLWPDTPAETVYDLMTVYRRYVVHEDGCIMLGEARPVSARIGDLLRDYDVTPVDLAPYLASLRPSLRPVTWRH